MIGKTMTIIITDDNVILIMQKNIKNILELSTSVAKTVTIVSGLIQK